nr:hypothetical protein [Chiayiivirga flava]
MRFTLHSLSRRAAAVAFATTLCAGAAHALPGQLDLGYGDNGVFVIGNGGSQERIDALLPASGGRVLAAGALYRMRDDQGGTAGNDMAVLRLRNDGSLDDTFGTGGIARINAGDGDSQGAYDIVRQPDGKLLVAGMLEFVSYTDAAIARLLPDGTLDTSFGNAADGGGRTGFRTINLGDDEFSHEEARGVLLQSTGKAVLAARAPSPVSGSYAHFTLTRVDANGDVDPTFGGGTGKVVTPTLLPETYEYVNGVARSAIDTTPTNNRILVFGYIAHRSRALMRRYLPDGAPDASFGTGGTVVVEDVAVGGVRTGMSSIEDAVILRDGRILAAGTASDRGFVVIRFQPNGTVDTSFGSNGRVLVKISDGSQYDEAYALTVQRNGAIIVTGYGTTQTAGAPRKDFMVVRLRSNGQRDAAFGDNGVVTYPMSDDGDTAYAVRVLGNGRIVVAGEALVGNTYDMAVLGLQGDPDIFADGFED